MGDYSVNECSGDTPSPLSVAAVEGDLRQFAFDQLYEDVVQQEASGVTVGADIDDGTVERFAYVESVDTDPGPQHAYAYAGERTEDGYEVVRFTEGERDPAINIAGAPSLFMVEGTASLDPIDAEDDAVALAEQVYGAVQELHANRYLAEAVVDGLVGARFGELAPGQLRFLGTLASRVDVSPTDERPDADTVIEQEDIEPLVDALYEEAVDVPFTTFLNPKTDVLDTVPLPYGAPEWLDAPDETITDARAEAGSEGSYDSRDEDAV